jgi:hypothetical protein
MLIVGRELESQEEGSTSGTMGTLLTLPLFGVTSSPKL